MLFGAQIRLLEGVVAAGGLERGGSSVFFLCHLYSDFSGHEDELGNSVAQLILMATYWRGTPRRGDFCAGKRKGSGKSCA